MESLDTNTATAHDFVADEPMEARTRSATELLASKILARVLQFRRRHPAHEACVPACPACQSPHLPKVITAVEEARPVTFVLPAFPGKSPNLSKVLGPLPDLGEKLALLFLDSLCREIREIYAPGAEIILCSDGRVFSDVVGMREADVTDYQDELDRMIAELGLRNISTFNLDAVGGDGDFNRLRRELMGRFGTSLEILRERVLRGSNSDGCAEDQESHRMYLGITRFLVEDSSFPGQTKSRTAIQKECKAKSYEVIRRSNAWSGLIAERFPDAVRLSIHPQACGSSKLGIRLIGAESWMTPWHGVAVKVNREFILMKRHEAESLGARLIRSADGRPSHFDLTGEIPVHLPAEAAT